MTNVLPPPFVRVRGLKLLAAIFLVSAASLTTGCGSGNIVESGAYRACTADCAGKECGDDGCGGACGVCFTGELCDAVGTCYDPNQCTPDCAGKECGDDGCGGTCGICGSGDNCNQSSGLCVFSPGIVWTDLIQSAESPPWGFDDAWTTDNADLTRVLDPSGSGTYALRQYGELNNGGTRAQLGLYSFRNEDFGALALSGQPVYVAQEWYFPERVDAGGDSAPWFNLMDWHGTDRPGGGNRWHTAPGLMLAEDGSMRVRWEWGTSPNRNSDWSSVGLPVGEWFDIEMRYRRSTTNNVTLQLWVNGSLILEQANVQTAAASHQVAEFYIKLYGNDRDSSPWTPNPMVKYVRNVRVSSERIWQ